MAQMVKNLPAMLETQVLIPGLGRSSGEGDGYPLQYSCLGNPMDRRAWWATVHGVTELDISKWLNNNIKAEINLIKLLKNLESDRKKKISFSLYLNQIHPLYLVWKLTLSIHELKIYNVSYSKGTLIIHNVVIFLPRLKFKLWMLHS